MRVREGPCMPLSRFFIVVAGVSHCSALASYCPQTRYDGPDSGTELCFCQLAENAGCRGETCSCPQGCSVTWPHEQTVTFANLLHPIDCPTQTALLTIPRSYYHDIVKLKHCCGSRHDEMQKLIAEMLRNGFDSHQQHVGEGPVLQCIHSPADISVGWLHLHTFCQGGRLPQDGLPPANASSAYCAVMHSLDEAASLSEGFVEWGTGAQIFLVS
mmetsp:Transcript_49959/g.108610  ORF Transcript_49959/g.108610 Transcript_49959/m.108610 type:complete len:214 (-) Transcript_49959:315-956(-)